MTNVTDLLDLDINDGEDTFPDLDASNKGSNNDLLQTPSPISENDMPPATQQSPTAFLTEVLQTTKIAKKIRHSTPPEARVRIDVFVSLRNNGQKVDTTKMPKTCITQFSLNRSPNAFRNTEFYKAIAKDARTHLALAAPFPAYTQVESPVLPVPEFRYPMFKFAKTETTCFTLKSYPSEVEIGWLPEPHKFVEGHIISQRLYVIFECVYKSKFAYTKIKKEPEEPLTRSDGTNHDMNKRTTHLIEEAERITELLLKDSLKAKSDWMTLLYRYHVLRYRETDTFDTDNNPQTDISDHSSTIEPMQPTVIVDEKTRKEKPNFQIQITHHGDRAVSHTPDTTGTPATTPSTNIPPYISAAPTNPALIQVDPNLLLQFVLQQQQEQTDTTAMIEQKPTLPIRERLGPMTPPPPYRETSIKTENTSGSRCVETRRHGLKDRPRPRENRRAQPYRTDRPRPEGLWRWPPTHEQQSNQHRGRERPHPPTHHRPACNRHYEDRRREDDRKRRSSTPSRSDKGSTSTNREGPPRKMPAIDQIHHFFKEVANNPEDIKNAFAKVQHYMEKMME